MCTHKEHKHTHTYFTPDPLYVPADIMALYSSIPEHVSSKNKGLLHQHNTIIIFRKYNIDMVLLSNTQSVFKFPQILH